MRFPTRTTILTSFTEQFLPNLDVLEDKAISHSLSSFSFSKDTFTFDDTTFFREDTRRDDGSDDDDDGHEPFGDNDMPMVFDGGDMADGAPEDFFTGDQAVNDDYNGDLPMPDDNEFGAGGSADGDGEAGEHQAQNGSGPFVPFDPRRVPNERDLVMAMTGDGDGEGGGMMDYFDQNFLKNWAGPEHWKLRKVVRRRAFLHRIIHYLFCADAIYLHSGRV